MLIRYYAVIDPGVGGDPAGTLYTGPEIPVISFIRRLVDDAVWDFDNAEWDATPLVTHYADMTLEGNHWVYDWTGGDEGDIVQAYMSSSNPVLELRASNIFFENSVTPVALTVQLAHYLHDQAVGTFDETGVTGDIFVECLPETPDQAIAVYATGGPGGDGKLPYDNPTIQVIVRGNQDPRAPGALAQTIYDLLHGFRNSTFMTSGAWIVGCRGIQSAPVHIGRDENGRHEYSLNFQLITLNANRRA